MTVNKIINKSDKQFVLATQYQLERKKKLINIHNKIKTEEKLLLSKLQKQTNQSKRKKIKKKLKIVKTAYSMLAS